jgi:hypothetical protein
VRNVIVILAALLQPNGKKKTDARTRAPDPRRRPAFNVAAGRANTRRRVSGDQRIARGVSAPRREQPLVRGPSDLVPRQRHWSGDEGGKTGWFVDAPRFGCERERR